jgi:hypothetical protein
MKAGDAVHDRITGEEWTLAYYDAARDEAAWFGWPEGYVEHASQRLTVIEPCSISDHVAVLQLWAERGADERGRIDWRTLTARRQLAELAARCESVS